MSRELIEDNGVNILEYLSGVTANTLGYDVNTVLTTGDGSSKPKGIVAAAGAGVTGSTAVTGAFTYANLVNLTYSLDAAARRVPSFGFMANATSIAAMRTLTDPASHYVFAPALDAPHLTASSVTRSLRTRQSQARQRRRSPSSLAI